MITIGIRAEPASVTFAIYDTDAKSVINVEEIKIPAALRPPEALKYVRSNLLDVLREYNVERAGIRITESFARSPNVERVQIEGVIQEAFASSELASYYIGQVASISRRIGISRERFKPLVDGAENISIENWDQLSRIKREAVLCAMGAENA